MRGFCDRTWAIFFCRGILGLIFFMAGVYKCFVMTPFGHARHYFVGPYADTFLPAWSLWITGTAVPLVELVAGALVLVGFKTRPALISLGGVLILVTFGHLLKEPLYAFHAHVIPRLALLTVVLLLPREDDLVSVDAFLRSRSSKSR
ncbi:MAG TPA: DoxX family protein [Vicinamibacteria bacterium]|nr:DoxX family protein [Vicinamibacteria bacterium]